MELNIKRYYAGNTIDVCYTAAAENRTDKVRCAKKHCTPEAVKRYNETLSIRKLIRIINANFTSKDLFITPTYKKENRPATIEELIKDARNFCRRLARRYARQGKEFKYVIVVGIGSKGAPHLHLIISGIDTALIMSAWKKGGCHFEHLYNTPEHTGLGIYLADQIKADISGDGFVSNKRWSCSRNVKSVQPEIEKVKKYEDWVKTPIAEKGYLIDINSIDASDNPITGLRSLFYRQVKAPIIRRSIILENGDVLTPKEAELRRREENSKAAGVAIEKQIAYSQEADWLNHVM